MPGHTQLAEWFNRFHKPIRSWLRTRAADKDIDDLESEVWVRLLKYDGSLVDNPQGYLFKVAGNLAAEWREKSANAKPHNADIIDELMEDSLSTCEESFWNEARYEAVRHEINMLPPRQRDLLLMHVNEGLTYKQIASREGLTYRTVLRDLCRAYATLRTNLRELQ